MRAGPLLHCKVLPVSFRWVMASSRLQWRKFTFFNKELCEENVEECLGGHVTCAVAEGGSLIFGDTVGNVFISDRSTQLSDKKFKLFRGEVKGLSYIYHPIHRHRQFIIAVGDDSENVSTSSGASSRLDNSVIKVQLYHTKFPLTLIAPSDIYCSVLYIPDYDISLYYITLYYTLLYSTI